MEVLCLNVLNDDPSILNNGGVTALIDVRRSQRTVELA
jgi:hypothetical protein